MIHVGDCLEVMRTLPDNSVDSIVTDPPYGLTTNKKGGTGAASVNLNTPHGRARIGTGNGPGGFMGMKWDADVPGVEVWQECLRVLKPGGWLLAFAGTRTQHRMAMRIEDAGFEIRDMIAWLYGSGFPKSHNGPWGGTALKPAIEPITVARKPLVGTVERNWQEYGTGALNIDACRVLVESEDRPPITGRGGIPARNSEHDPRAAGEVAQPHNLGRWPANVIHDGSDEVVEAFPSAPGQQGDLVGTEPSRPAKNTYGEYTGRKAFKARREGEASANRRYTEQGGTDFAPLPGMRRDHPGSAARFFYCAKASRADRYDGCEGFVASNVHGPSGDGRCWDIPGSNSKPRENNHPTVKPTDLMRYLCRLVTPPGGTVLDPFMGSGSTGRGAIAEGFQFIGIELDPDYAEIARRRITAMQPGLPLAMPA